MNTVSIVTLVSTACAIIGVVCAVLGYQKGVKKDSQDTGKVSGVMLSDIGYIKGGIDDIKHKQEKSDDRHIELCERVTAVESSASQAHKRIDRIENKD